MNEQLYLKELRDKLATLDPPMLEAIINQYKQIFDDGHKAQKDDSQIIEEIGTTDFVSDYYLKTLAERKDAKTAQSSTNESNNSSDVEEGTVTVDSRGVQTGSYTNSQTEQRPTSSSVFRSLLVGFGLLLFNVAIVLGPYLGVWGAIIGFLVTGIALVLSGVAVAIVGFVPISAYVSVPYILLEHPVLLIATAVILVCIGVILTLIMLFFGKHLSTLTLKYLQWNFKVIRGE